jgi:hypothetical protein
MRLSNKKAILTLATTATLVACGAAQDPLFQPLACGEGTVERDGKCVVADAGTQVDTGATADSGIEGGPADSGVSSDASAGPDPCPVEPIEVNCDQSCGPGRSTWDCNAIRCHLITYRQDGYPVETAMVHLSATQASVIRTPNKPGRDYDCDNPCPGTALPVTYALAFQVKSAGSKYRVTVGDPWLIEEVGQHQKVYCAFDPPKTARYRGCAVAATDKTFFVWTQDVNATARNIRVEPVSAVEGCP